MSGTYTYRVIARCIDGRFRLAVYFIQTDTLIERFKKLTDAQWSESHKAWHIPDTLENRKRFGMNKGNNLDKSTIISETAKLDSELLEKFETFKQHLQSKRYADSTIHVYMDVLKVFFVYFSHKKYTEISNEDVINFNNHYILGRGLSASYQNQLVNGLKLFYDKAVGKDMHVENIHRPRKEKKLPNVLSKAEVKMILDSLKNLKHRAMLSLIYSCGLRSGELIQLRLEHVDAQRHLLIIKQAKGKKDRITPLSDKTIKLLRDYVSIYKPSTFLFESIKKSVPYDIRSLQSVIKQATQKAGIKKPVSLHWLRHSYATHLLESGTDLRYIQEILGHKSSRTTEIYTHVSTKSIQNIVSPFDTL